MKQIGWLVWNKMTPHTKEFDKIALTEGDRKSGYVAQKVYIDESEKAQ